MSKKILVVGDAMLDAYHFGQVNRISPEAPVPVFLETDDRRHVPGGAANVAVNIAAIGVEVSFCSVIGADENGKIFLGLMNKNGVDTNLVLELKTRRTVTKLRFIGPGNQQILRVDDEDTEDIPEADVTDLLGRIEQKIKDFSVIVLSDYMKGMLSAAMTRGIIGVANGYGIPVLVDVKDPDYAKYGNAMLLKPNRRELGLLTGMAVSNEKDIAEVATYLCRNVPCDYVLATLGAEGMLLADKNGLISRIASAASDVYDVTGAGDTSIAYLAAEIANGKDIREAMITANYAAGIQVSKVGTSVVYPYEVQEALKRAGIENKADDVEDSMSDRIFAIRQRKENGERIVFTNGCFDILHIGHIDYLRKAKKLGDILVIGLNTDASVKRLKGEDRPVNSMGDRRALLTALSFVDYVIPFDEDTPLRLIKEIMPDVLVKGGDYSADNIVGADVVKESGGKVAVIPFVEGHSTTEIIKKIKKGSD